ncbi:hypothetical protein BRL53_05165 [Corynebacterium ulcerans]|uniref:hypothetical protein n=1 Tax=Corynebacterium ulcerans TaxID=65058 RepID=UPI000C786F58|nr:hypothetical protein [Corynebacterium ulcerans]PLW00124.1 hypothetical protein BRL53_05165 [Corynebacterium ulcerans]
MAKTWFDDFDQTLPENEQGEEPKTLADPPDRSVLRPPDSQIKSWIFSGVVTLVFAGIAVASGLWLTRSGISIEPSGTQEAAPQSALTTTSSSVPTPAPRCPKQPKSTNTTPEGTFVRFQEAYFSGNVKALEAVIDPKSYLASVDWMTIASPMIGSDFCVDAKKTDRNGVIDASTTVRSKDGKELLYVQSVTLILDGDTWKITAIDDRKT